jgi:hypothetical protein
MRYRRQLAFSILALALISGGCTTLPDVKPFAEATSGLAAAAGAHYRSVASDVASLPVKQLQGENDGAFQQRSAQIRQAQQVFAETDKSLDALFAAMTAYSEKLANLVAAGKTGPDAAQSLLDSAKGFAQVAGVALPGLGAAAAPIVQGFKLIADEFTKMQAQRSLREAVAAAEPGVKLVAEQFEVIYGQAIMQAANSIRNTRLEEASAAAGPAVIGFNDIVERNYNAYYRVLNGFVESSNPGTPAAWRGFCRDSKGTCVARDELEAVSLVEARIEAIRPIVTTYRAKVAAIDATLAHRQSTSKAVIKAVRAWALEHQKVRASLEDGSAVSAFNLRAALMELGALLGREP